MYLPTVYPTGPRFYNGKYSNLVEILEIYSPLLIYFVECIGILHRYMFIIQKAEKRECKYTEVSLGNYELWMYLYSISAPWSTHLSCHTSPVGHTVNISRKVCAQRRAVRPLGAPNIVNSCHLYKSKHGQFIRTVCNI